MPSAPVSGRCRHGPRPAAGGLAQEVLGGVKAAPAGAWEASSEPPPRPESQSLLEQADSSCALADPTLPWVSAHSTPNVLHVAVRSAGCRCARLRFPHARHSPTLA
eukprot:scaffold198375_cov38-Tisochrysis_lutea.AAC.1